MTRSNIREVKGLSDYDLEAPEMRFPAHIMQGKRMTDEALMQIVMDKFARESSNLSMEKMFFFPAEISNQNLDSYFTKMAENSLRNYAEDATAGVAFQNSHNSRELGVGYVINGEFVPGDIPRVFADMYTVRGLRLNPNLGTDDFIAGVEAGLIRDVSIGFKSGIDYKETCNICQNEYWSYSCSHIAGMTYEVADDPNADPTGQPVNTMMAFVWIQNARLSEVSAVYDGATPDAMIMTKAMREMRAGRLTATVRTEIQKRFHVDIFEPSRVFNGSNPKDKEHPKVQKTERSVKEMNELEQAQERARLAEEKATLADQKRIAAESNLTAAETKCTEAETRATAAEARATELENSMRSSFGEFESVDIKAENTPAEILRAVSTRLTEVEALAKQTTELRTQEIEKALESGVRAFGDGFDQEKKRAFLDKLDLSEIAETGSEWEVRASGKFKPGRKSADEGGEDPEANSDNRDSEPRGIEAMVPDYAYNAL